MAYEPDRGLDRSASTISLCVFLFLLVDRATAAFGQRAGSILLREVENETPTFSVLCAAQTDGARTPLSQPLW